MDFNVKDGHSYLEGVPVKISSKFIPPRPVSLPFAFDVNPSLDILNDMYDFTLEKSVIEHHTNRILQLEEIKLNSSSESTSETLEDNASNTSLKMGDSAPMPHSNAQNMLSWKSDVILQPKPQQIQDKSSEGASQNSLSKINLSDFENDTSSPFDYMELRTINDMEELSCIFQGIHNNSQEEASSVKNPPEISGNVSKSKSFPFPMSSKDMDDTAHGKDLGCGSLPASSYQIPNMLSSLKQVDGYPSESYRKLSQVPYIPSNAGACATNSNVPPMLRSSKSFSDISTLSKIDRVYSEKERSRTPPSTFLYPENTEPTLCKDAPSNGTCDNELPDPYNGLENSEKEFVNSITEMGFSRPQVARTVKHLGTDEKKVIEHLCQIQALEESGYESIEAEAALHLHNYNSEEAKMFLDLVIQFQDLGFEKKAVKKALVQNKNDWNKTIDTLLL